MHMRWGARTKWCPCKTACEGDDVRHSMGARVRVLSSKSEMCFGEAYFYRYDTVVVKEFGTVVLLYPASFMSARV